MKNIIVCDLDGTLANCEHRLHHIQRSDANGLKRKPDWDAFFAGMRGDGVNGAVMHVLDKFISFGGSRYDIIYCTGRPERCRADTEWWFREVAGWSTETKHGFQMFMRADEDNRADHIVKQEILDNHIPKDRVLFVLDDRQSVVDMWRRNGLTCFQVAPGKF
jgi:hypothetical protein